MSVSRLCPALGRITRDTMAMAVLLGCIGCASVGVVDATAPPPAVDHAYFVIGVEPEDARVIVFKGDAEGGRFSANPLANASLYGNPSDGFIMGETHAGNTLAITKVQIIKPKQVFMDGIPFEPCGGVKTLVFTAPAGKVVYLASVTFERSADGGLIPHYRTDLEAARAFLRKRYPLLADRLEQGRYDLLPSGPAECPKY